MIANNIIAFPKQNPRLPDISNLKIKMEEALEDGSLRKAHALEASDLFTSILVENLSLAGFEVNKPAHMKDLALAIETLKSYILKYYGIYHPVQNISEELFTIRKDGVILLKIANLHKLMKEPKENDYN